MSTKIVSKCCGAETIADISTLKPGGIVMIHCKKCKKHCDTKELPQEKTWETLEVGDEIIRYGEKKRKITRIDKGYALSNGLVYFVDEFEESGYTIVQPQETIEIEGKKYPKSVLELLEGKEIE